MFKAASRINSETIKPIRTDAESIENAETIRPGKKRFFVMIINNYQNRKRRRGCFLTRTNARRAPKPVSTFSPAHVPYFHFACDYCLLYVRYFFRAFSFMFGFLHVVLRQIGVDAFGSVWAV